MDLNHRPPGPEPESRKIYSLVGVALTSRTTPKILPQLVHRVHSVKRPSSKDYRGEMRTSLWTTHENPACNLGQSSLLWNAYGEISAADCRLALATCRVRPCHLSCRSPKTPRDLNVSNITCYITSLNIIHFKCVLNFGEGQEFLYFRVSAHFQKHFIRIGDGQGLFNQAMLNQNVMIRRYCQRRRMGRRSALSLFCVFHCTMLTGFLDAVISLALLRSQNCLPAESMSVQPWTGRRGVAARDRIAARMNNQSTTTLFDNSRPHNLPDPRSVCEE